MRPAFEYIASKEWKNIIGAELGVDQGFNALEILTTLPNLQELILVDSYENDYGKFLKIQEKLKEFPVRWEVMDSVSAAGIFSDRYFDFVYIDADHSYKGVMDDLKAWIKKVKMGGILCGHDYSNSHDPEVKLAVDKFARDNKLTVSWIPNPEMDINLMDFWIQL